MKYINKTFSAPVSSSKVSQKQWNAIWQKFNSTLVHTGNEMNKVKVSRGKPKG